MKRFTRPVRYKTFIKYVNASKDREVLIVKNVTGANVAEAARLIRDLEGAEVFVCLLESVPGRDLSRIIRVGDLEADWGSARAATWADVDEEMGGFWSIDLGRRTVIALVPRTDRNLTALRRMPGVSRPEKGGHVGDAA